MKNMGIQNRDESVASSHGFASVTGHQDI
jgi:hypothetical protein